MKRTTFLGLFILIFSICNAQFREKTQDNGFHQHKGFYLSMSLGPNFASISDKVAGNYDYVFSGTGAQFDLKIGGAISENLILHATIISNSLTGPNIKSDGESRKTSNNLTMGEAMFGAGITYYVMPSNILLSGSLGLGNFTVLDNDQKKSVSSDRGFSMQLKAGKEWWVSKRWGLGVALTYGSTNLTNSPGGSVKELMNSNNIGILFNASLH
jgi:hypothetical protein